MVEISRSFYVGEFCIAETFRISLEDLHLSMQFVKLSIPDRSCGGRGPSSPRLSSSSSPQLPFPEFWQRLRSPPWTGWQEKERAVCPYTWVRRSDHNRQPKQTKKHLVLTYSIVWTLGSIFLVSQSVSQSFSHCQKLLIVKTWLSYRKVIREKSFTGCGWNCRDEHILIARPNHRLDTVEWHRFSFFHPKNCALHTVFYQFCINKKSAKKSG